MLPNSRSSPRMTGMYGGSRRRLSNLPTAGDRLATDVGVFTISRMDGYRIIEIELRARHRGT
jgi:hypothetical protein